MKKILQGLTVVGGLLTAQYARAVSFYDPSSSLGLSTADLVSTVTKVIQWVLGLLGLVAVIMIIIGGFRWMTAGGNEEKVEAAKKILTASIIGLIIVLLAWAIVIFATGTLNNTSGVS
ncbi:MAG: hypothetical protein HYV34_01575 [Candidatus Kerfeldbacteria bacterium]|nr:hypothetical protein [Candidatus Kerfeldbacteria bacterium]